MGYKNGMVYIWAGNRDFVYRLNTSDSNMYNMSASGNGSWEIVLDLYEKGYGYVSRSSVVVVSDYMFNFLDTQDTDVFRINLVSQNGSSELSVTGEASIPYVSRLFHANAIFIQYLQEIWILGGTTNNAESKQDTIYKSTIMWPTYEPTFVPSTPSIEPSIQPSTEPSVEPSRIPTQYPTFVHNGYNISVTATILLNCYFSSIQVNSSVELQQDIIYSLKIGSDTVRFDLKSINDIDIEILAIDEYNNDTFNSSNTSYTTTTRILFEISFQSYAEREGWVVDIDDIMDQFGLELTQCWGSDTVSWIKLQRLTIVDTGTYSTTSEDKDIEMNRTTSMSTSTGSITTRQSTRMTATASGQDGKLGNISNYTAVIVCVIAFCVSVIGWMDAACVRHNEIFKLSTIVVVTMYFMDVVSGLSAGRCVFDNCKNWCLCCFFVMIILIQMFSS